MNEDLDLVKILKDCPKGTKLYSPLFGEVTLRKISLECGYPISVRTQTEDTAMFNECGIYYTAYDDSECLLFPSKDQRDWSKFKAPRLKKSRFDPKTLQTFDKVLVKSGDFPWRCDIFSYHRRNKRITCCCTTNDYIYDKCIPYNEETKHLVGTMEEAPEYYRYWEE